MVLTKYFVTLFYVSEMLQTTQTDENNLIFYTLITGEKNQNYPDMRIKTHIKEILEHGILHWKIAKQETDLQKYVRTYSLQ